MAICVQRHANVSKQATLLDGHDVGPLKRCVCGCGLNRFVHEGMNHISNVEVHLKTRSGNVNIYNCYFHSWFKSSQRAYVVSFIYYLILTVSKKITGGLNS